jgi:hypothetical protein
MAYDADAEASDIYAQCERCARKMHRILLARTMSACQPHSGHTDNNAPTTFKPNLPRQTPKPSRAEEG